MEKTLDSKELKGALSGYISRAKKILGNKDETEKLLNDALKKSKNPGLGDKVIGNLKLLFSLVKDYTNGSYREIPVGSLLMIIAALIYFVSPIDLIPDFLPGGLLDDAAVIAFTIKQISSDLDKYREWKECQV